MTLAEFNIHTMCGKKCPVVAFTHSQAITIWKASKPTELFKSCQLIKSSKERDRYYELRELSNPSKNDISEISTIVDKFRTTDVYKKFKRYPSFKRDPRNGE
jgi:hypothetical protein